MDVPKEREVAINVPGSALVLEGRFQPGSAGGAVVAPPHPLQGGSLDSPVVNEIAFGLHVAEIASLRFNWRGVGASRGHATDDVGAAVADLSAAWAWVRDSCDAPLLCAGYSFGAVTTVRVALGRSDMARLVLVAPPVSMLRELELERLNVPVAIIVGSDDPLAPAAELSRQARRIPRGRLEVLANENHFFSRGRLSDLSELVRLALLDDGRTLDLDLT